MTGFKLLHYEYRYDMDAALIVIKVDNECDFKFNYSMAKYCKKQLFIEHIKTIELDNTSIKFLVGFDVGADSKLYDLSQLNDDDLVSIDDYFKREK